MSDQSSLDVGLVAGGSGNLEVMAISVAGDGHSPHSMRRGRGSGSADGRQKPPNHAKSTSASTQRPQKPIESSKLKPRYAQQP